MEPHAFTLEPRGPFSLETIRTFACGLFTSSRACSVGGEVTLAFPSDEGFAPAAVRLSFDGRVIQGRAYGQPASEALRAQVARILCVDQDARPFWRMVEGEPVLARLAARRPGFRPVVFYSPYAAAGWGVMTQRLRMGQAAALLRRISLEAGDAVEVEGETVAAFPRPQTVLARASVPGVAETKWRWMQGVARAALDGELSLPRLKAEGYTAARERLLRLPGVGPWTADTVLLRGVGPVDALPLCEPNLHRAVAEAYGLAQVDDPQLVEAAERWRPFRMWAAILLVSSASRTDRASAPVRGRRQASLVG